MDVELAIRAIVADAKPSARVLHLGKKTSCVAYFGVISTLHQRRGPNYHIGLA